MDTSNSKEITMKKRLWKRHQVVACGTESLNYPIILEHSPCKEEKGEAEHGSPCLVQTDNRWGAVTCACALMFMVSVICTKFRPIKQRFVSWAVRLTQVKGSVCLNDFRSPEKLPGTASAFATLSTQGCAHLSIQKRQLAILTLFMLCSMAGSPFSIHRKQVIGAEKEKCCVLLYTM